MLLEETESYARDTTPQRAATGPTRYERATPKWARSVRAQPVTDLAPYAPVGTEMLAPLQQVRSPVFSTVSALSAVAAGGAPTRAMCSKEG